MRSTGALIFTLATLSSALKSVTVTETLSACDATPYETIITATQVVTKTYCPACGPAPSSTGNAVSGGGGSGSGGSGSGSGGSGSGGAEAVDVNITIYETIIPALCTSGAVWSLTPTTYTITESCDGGSFPSGHIPADFTVEVVQCNACATPGPVTVTEPCGCRATEGTSLGPLPTGSSGAGAGSDYGAGSGSGSGSGSNGASGASQPRPAMAQPTASATPSSSSSAHASASGVEEYEGGAAQLRHSGYALVTLACAVGVLAFGL